MPKNKNQRSKTMISQDVQDSLENQLKWFINDETASSLAFPPSLTNEERKFIHELGRTQGLKTRSTGKNEDRFVTVYKTKAKLPPVCLSPISVMEITTYVKTIKKEIDDALKLTEDLSHLSITEKSINLLTRYQPRIPDKPFNNIELLKFRSTLPIWPFYADVNEAVEANQVLIITGDTGCGKTTQVPQFLMDEAAKKKEYVRIFCSMPRRVAAVTVAERVSEERNEKVGHSVGYQIHLDSRFTSNTILTYCTNGILLRSLVNDTSFLENVSHIIIDEVHERDRLCDFMLIILREALKKHSHLKLILMSATVDKGKLSEYFDNCPDIHIPGRLFHVNELYLGKILEKLKFMTPKMLAVKKDLENEREKKKAFVYSKNDYEEDVGSLSNNSSLEVYQNDELCSKMDQLLANVIAEGTQEAFIDLVHFMDSENINVDYQERRTGFTALMAASLYSENKLAEDLISYGATVQIKNYVDGKTALDMARHDSLWNLLNNQRLTEERIKRLKEIKDAAKESQLIHIYEKAHPEDINVELILAILNMILGSSRMGAILIFLPGYDHIMAVKDGIYAQINKFNHHGPQLQVYTMHSKMQSGDQRDVFRPSPSGKRKVVLATNIAETSITIEDVVFVIDSGKVKETSFDAMSGAHKLECSWISKACSDQRAGRAGRTRNGVCFHLFSLEKREQLLDFKVPEILRQPLQELCLQARQLAPPDISIASFLGKAMDPPSPFLIKHAIQVLKKLGALDSNEKLTPLGRLLLDLSLEPHLGKMVIYSIFLKCLNPVLTIVCCLSVGDPFKLPVNPQLKKVANDKRIKLSQETLSDHAVFLTLYEDWEEAEKRQEESKWCEENFVNGTTMRQIRATRQQIVKQLEECRLLKGPDLIAEANKHSYFWPITKAALVSGLYPTLARVDRQLGTLRSEIEPKLVIHPSSVLRGSKANEKLLTSTNKDLIRSLPTDWVVYEDMHGIGRFYSIRTCTVVTAASVCLFAGPMTLPDNAVEYLDQEDKESKGKVVLQLDRFLTFQMDKSEADLLLGLRDSISKFILRRLSNTTPFWTVEENSLTRILMIILMAEDAVPYLKSPDFKTYVRYKRGQAIRGLAETACITRGHPLARSRRGGRGESVEASWIPPRGRPFYQQPQRPLKSGGSPTTISGESTINPGHFATQKMMIQRWQQQAQSQLPTRARSMSYSQYRRGLIRQEHLATECYFPFKMHYDGVHNFGEESQEHDNFFYKMRWGNASRRIRGSSYRRGRYGY